MSDFLEKRIVKVTFDYAGTDSAGVSNATQDLAHPTGVFIPDNAIITKAFYEVETTFTSGVAANDAATIAIHVEGAGDLVAAIAISDASTVWDAGIRGTLANADLGADDAAHDSAVEVIALRAATYIKVTDREEVTFTLAGSEDLTSGKLHLYVEYVVGD